MSALKSFLGDTNMPTMPRNIDILLQILNVAKLKKEKTQRTDLAPTESSHVILLTYTTGFVIDLM